MCLHINGNLKIMMKFVHRNNCNETIYCSLLWRMAKMEMDCILKHLASLFQSSRTHHYAKTKNVPWITVLAKKNLTDALAQDFIPFSCFRLLQKNRKKEFEIVLAEKHQKCRDRAPLTNERGFSKRKVIQKLLLCCKQS